MSLFFRVHEAKYSTVCPGIWTANTGTGRGHEERRDLIWEDMRVGHHKGDGGIWLGRTEGWDTKRGMEGFCWVGQEGETPKEEWRDLVWADTSQEGGTPQGGRGDLV